MEYHKFLSDEIEIILVNDASTDRDCDGGVGFWQKADTRQKIRYMKNEENLGFGGSMNRGAKLSKRDILVFLSNDVVVSGNFIEQIEKEIENEENILIGGRVLYWDTGWNVVNNTIFPYCEGWLLACTKEVWDNLGGFDPRYAPYDYEDVDLSATAIELGYRLVGLNSPHLRHIGGQTANYDEKRLSITHRNKALFFKKWKDKVDMIGEASHHGK
jgi:GT2 family glycosyltransferase